MVEDIDRRFLNQGKVQCSLAEPFSSQDRLVFFQGRSQTAIFIEQTQSDTSGFLLRQESGVFLTERKVPERHGEVADQVLAPLQ